jgi:nucleotide-binding universal stress UspA family protein
MTRILVPVDYSERSRQALHCAATLAAGLDAEITVLHAWDCPPFARTTRAATPAGGEMGLDQLLVEAARHELEAFVGSAALDAHAKRLLLLSPLPPVRALLEAIESGEYDLVVMGTHGRGAVTSLMLGSVAQRIVELSSIPVVLVPDAAKHARAHGDASH